MLLLALFACENGPIFSGNVATYDVTLNVLTPSNQAPFEGLDRLVLRLDHAAGDPEEFELSSTSGSPQIEGLGDLEDTRLTLAGYSGDALVSYGTSQPVTAHDETDISETVLVTEIGSAGWMTALEKKLAIGAGAPDGKGSFYLFGGDEKGYFIQNSSSTNVVRRFDVAPPASDLAVVDVGTMPTFEAANSSDEEGQTGLTATLLTGTADDAGLILLAGGSSYDIELATSSQSAFLFDPATGEYTSTENNMREPRTGHFAIEMQSGDVLIAGGWGGGEGEGSLYPSEKLELYKRNERKFERIGDQLSYGAGTHGASLGSKGALVCGGSDLMGGIWTTIPDCQHVQGDTSGTGTPLDISRAHHQMVPLDDGRAMIIGGISIDDPEVFEDRIDAVPFTAIFDAETGLWSDSDDLNIARAGFSATTLPDGRVLVVGGNTRMDLYQGNDGAPIACAEIWTEGQGWELLDGCSASSASGSLPEQVFWPTLIADPVYGVLIVGGLDGDAEATSGVTYFAASPEM